MTLGCDRFAMRHVDDQSKIVRLSFQRGELHFCEAAAAALDILGEPPLPDRLLLRAVDIVLEHRAPAAAGFLPNAKSLKKSGV